MQSKRPKNLRQRSFLKSLVNLGLYHHFHSHFPRPRHPPLLLLPNEQKICQRIIFMEFSFSKKHFMDISMIAVKILNRCCGVVD